MMTNPFHYFAPFKNTREDRKKFFGREHEESELVDIFRKSPVTIITGPSGSGKTSLIECGLFQRLKVQEHEIFKIRFDQDEHVGSILIKLFKEWNLELSKIFSLLIFNYSGPHEFFHFLKKGSDEKLFLKALQTENSNISDLLDMEEFPLFSKVLLSELKSNSSDYDFNYIEDAQDLVRKSLKDSFDKQLSVFAKDQWGVKHFLLLDQFEEFYSLKGYSNIEKQKGFEIDGYRVEIEEIDTIGLLASTILEQLSSINIIISFKEEYLGSFESFNQWIPNLHRKKYRISLPDKTEIESNILLEYFRKYKILAEDGVLEHILGVAKKLGATQQYQLPFMQMYLYELYEYAVAKDHIEDGTVILNKEGIRKYRGIKDIVSQKVNKISISLRSKIKDEKSEKVSISKIRDFVLRILREFKTEGDSKRKYKYYDGALVDFQLRGIEQDDKLIEYIPFCVMELAGEKLIRYEEEEHYLELAHDTLSGIIDQFGIGKDYLEILKDNFDSNYELFLSSKSSDNMHILSESFMGRINDEDLETILTENGIVNSSKKDFWDKSYTYNQAAKVRRKRFIILGFSVLSILLIAALLSWLQTYVANIKSDDLKGVSEQRQKTNESEGIIFQSVGTSYGMGKTDIKSAYDSLRIDTLGLLDIALDRKADTFSTWGVVRDWFKFDETLQPPDTASMIKNLLEALDSNKKFKIRKNYFQELEGNRDKRPFYVKSLQLPNQDHIETTKSRKFNGSEDTILIYALSHDYLQQFTVDLNTMTRIDSIPYPSELSTFEPFNDNDNNSKVLVSEGHDLVILDDKLKEEYRYNSGHYFAMIEELDNHTFLCLENDLRTMFLFYLKENKGTIVRFNLSEEEINIGKIYYINYLEATKEIIFGARNSAGRSTTIYKLDPKGKLGGINFNNIISIKSMKVQKGDIYFADASSVYNIKASSIGDYVNMDGNTPPPILVHGDNENWEIRTIDVKGNQYIIGTQGNLAQTYFNRGSTYRKAIRKQKLIGHSDDIINVSYVRNGDFAITSSHGGSIKIWDVRQQYGYKRRVHPKNNKISKLKFKDNALYASFKLERRLIAEDGPEYIAQFNDTLKNIKNYYYRGFINQRNRKLSCFDFDVDGSMMVGTDKEVKSGQLKNSPTPTIEPEISSTVVDVRIKDSLMVVGTVSGIEIFIKKGKEFLKQKLPIASDIDSQINAVDISTKSNKIIGAGENGNVYVWNLEDYKVDTLHAHHDKVEDVCFSPDGKFFVSGSWDNRAIVWNVMDEEATYEKTPITVHYSDVEDVDITYDKKNHCHIIATASSDRTVQLHKVSYGKENNIIITRSPSLIDNNDISFRAVTFGASSNIIYTGDRNGIIKKWDTNKFLVKK